MTDMLAPPPERRETPRGVRQSVRKRFLLVVLAVTTAALLVMSAAMVAFDLQSYHESSVADLLAQADLVGNATAPALTFDDAQAARENLALLKVSPKVTAAAVFDARGRLFASYLGEGATVADLPAGPAAPGVASADAHLTVFKMVQGKSDLLGTVYLKSRYELRQRLIYYLEILSAVLLVSLLLAAWMSSWLQDTITRPILAITEVAREVVATRDFSLRAQKTTEDELGFMVDTFNAMLAEVGQRSRELQASNASLEHEMETRRAAEEQLRIADRRKDEFLATLAHELRNPLAPISNALMILRRAPADGAAGATARAMAERQLRQLVRLVDDLLDVSRITTGKLELQTERVELAAVVKSAIETATPALEAREHHFEVSLPQAPIFLRADPTRLAQVFLNLLNNAAKFTMKGGRITLTAALESPGMLAVTVADNGIGIAAEMQQPIFDMFSQVDRALERQQAGLGVGLSLARHLVTLHGGSITAESAGLGHGSRFIVRLPVLPLQRDHHPHQESAATPAGAAGGGLRILLADDNEDFAASMALLLTAAGHEVKVANDGESGLAAFREFLPDAAILDIGLPNLNGYDLARRVRDIERETGVARRVMLIAATGWGQADDQKRGRDAGFDFHLVKPVEVQELLGILAGAASRGAPAK